MKVASQAADWATTSQDEADRNRGRELRGREEELRRRTGERAGARLRFPMCRTHGAGVFQRVPQSFVHASHDLALVIGARRGAHQVHLQVQVGDVCLLDGYLQGDGVCLHLEALGVKNAAAGDCQ